MSTIIISDLHLGSDNCQAKSLHHFLENLDENCKRLILNGDVFDSMDFRRLKKHHWHVLSQLRKLSDKLEVVWVVGNHDGGNAEVVSHLLGIEVFDEYVFDSEGKKILVLHGHIFDDFITKRPIITWFADRIYRFLQKIDRWHYIAKIVKRGSKIYLRCTDKIRTKSLIYAKQKGCDMVCVGHTHYPIEDYSGETHYFNSGCWTEKPCHYLEIKNGKVNLKTFPPVE